MTTLHELQLDAEAIDRALAQLTTSARAIAAGTTVVATNELERLIAFFECTVHGTHSRACAELLHRDAELDARQGRGLLGILRSSVHRVDGSTLARRQFFHAARVYVTVRHAQIEDERRWIAAIERVDSRALSADQQLQA